MNSDKMARRLAVVILIMAIFAVSFTLAEPAAKKGKSLTTQFKSWLHRFAPGKKVTTALQKTFQTNVAKISKYNKKNANAASRVRLAPGPNTGMTQRQFASTRLGAVVTNTHHKRDLAAIAKQAKAGTLKRSVSSLPNSYDWRGYGRIAPIVDQGQCGSCWAFSSVAAVESAWGAAHRSPPPHLSQQQLIDCSVAPPDNGCNGGNPATAMQYIHDNGGIYGAVSYPYNGHRGACAHPPGVGYTAALSAVQVLSGDETAIMSWIVNHGPVVAIVDANNFVWQHYSGGIITGGCATNVPNHAIVIAGFATIFGIPVWIVRNSWGPGWGDKGYTYLRRGQNTCGINNYVYAPII